MSQNLISLSLSAPDLAEIDQAIDTLEQKLTGLIGLTPDQRRALTKMGDKSEAFCRQVVVVLSQNKGLVPPNYDLAETQNDLATFDALRTRFARLGKLSERADDSMTALGSDVMSAALEGYGLLKVSGKAQGLDGLRDAISSRFSRKSKGEAPTASNGAATAATAA